MTRPTGAQLQTQYWLLAMFNAKLAVEDLPEAERATAEAGKAATEERIRALGGHVHVVSEAS